MFHCKQNMMNEDYFLIHVLNLSVQTTTNKNNALYPVPRKNVDVFLE